MFSASTVNGFKKMAFDDNVYFDLLSLADSNDETMEPSVTFPCDPDNNQSRNWISAPTCM
jgi:hypothetical protein